MKGRLQFGARRYRTRLRSHLGRPDCAGALIVLFLLIFFLLMASSVTRLSGIRVRLPEIKAPSVTGLGRLVVTVTAPTGPGQRSKVFFMDRELAPEEFRQKLQESRAGNVRTLIVRADRAVPAETIYRILADADAARMECFLVGQEPEINPEMRFE